MNGGALGLNPARAGVDGYDGKSVADTDSEAGVDGYDDGVNGYDGDGVADIEPRVD